MWYRDLHVPLQFSRDAIEYLVQTKGTLDNGWWWSNPRLSAPWTFEHIAYPSNNNVDQLVISLIGVFRRDVGFAINVSWIIFLAASGVVATWCSLRLGMSKSASFVAGTLFALSPFALWRSTGHLALVTYLVPIPSTAAILVATRRIDRLRDRTTVPFVIGCLLLGFDYIYYAFFGCFILLVASVIAWSGNRRDPAWRTGTGLILVTSLAILLNLVPSFVTWGRDGRPSAMQEKLVAESETEGLKLRHLVGPVGSPTLGLFTHWSYLEYEARFPLEGENGSDRLGVVGTAGFVALLWWLLIRRSEKSDHHASLQAATAQLTCAMVLLGTVGGAGSLFSLLISTDIRAYNRVFPFIDFFSLVAVGMLIDLTANRWRWSRGALGGLAIGGLLLLGVYDQSHAAREARARYEPERAELEGLRSFVAALETRLGPAAMVFQLPVEGFPSDEGLARTLPYDQAKPYLVSNTLRWSFPAFADGLAKWQRQVAGLPVDALAAAVRMAGFSAILIDRRGFDDDAKELLGQLGTDRSSATLIADDRYVALDPNKIPFAADVAQLPRLTRDFQPGSGGLLPCSGNSSYSIDRVGSIVAPFAWLPVRAPWFGDITVSGWALDTTARLPARDVDVVMAGKVFPSVYGLIRRDVSTTLNVTQYKSVGFTTRIPRSGVPRGVSELSIRVVAAHGDCYYDTPPIPVRVL